MAPEDPREFTETEGSSTRTRGCPDLILGCGPVGSRSSHGVGLGGLGQDGPGGVRVAGGGLLVDAEDEGEVEWVGPAGEGYFELAVDAKSFEGDGEGGLARCRTTPSSPPRTLASLPC